MLCALAQAALCAVQLCRHWCGDQLGLGRESVSLPLFCPDFSTAEAFGLVMCIKGPWARGRVKEGFGR